jgi:hypothetical protein
LANLPIEENSRRPDKHFDDRYWIDMVRGLYNGEYAVEMQRHLDNGCDVCRRDRDIWLGLVNTANAGGLYEPPEEIVARVKGLASNRAATTRSFSKKNTLFCMHFFESTGLATRALTIL